MSFASRLADYNTAEGKSPPRVLQVIPVKEVSRRKPCGRTLALRGSQCHARGHSAMRAPQVRSWDKVEQQPTCEPLGYIFVHVGGIQNTCLWEITCIKDDRFYTSNVYQEIWAMESWNIQTTMYVSIHDLIWFFQYNQCMYNKQYKFVNKTF